MRIADVVPLVMQADVPSVTSWTGSGGTSRPWLPAIDAIAVGKALEPFNILFLEGPVAPDDVESWGRVRRALAHTPIAGGERFVTKWGAHQLAELG